jgi:hypothetical protein
MPVVKRVLILVAGLLLVTGCSQDPQVAAHVGGKSISVKDVDILGKALCAERVESGQAAATSMSAVRGSALAALIDSALDAEVAKDRKLSYDKATLGSSVAQLESLVAKLPADDRDRGRELITDLLRGQMQLSTAAAGLVQQSGQQLTQDAVNQVVQQLETEQAGRTKISVNPEFDSPGFGRAGDGEQSVSLAISSTAKAARKIITSSTPSATYVGSLPAAQKCG